MINVDHQCQRWFQMVMEIGFEFGAEVEIEIQIGIGTEIELKSRFKLSMDLRLDWDLAWTDIKIERNGV